MTCLRTARAIGARRQRSSPIRRRRLRRLRRRRRRFNVSPATTPPTRRRADPAREERAHRESAVRRERAVDRVARAAGAALPQPEAQAVRRAVARTICRAATCRRGRARARVLQRRSRLCARSSTAREASAAADLRERRRGAAASMRGTDARSSDGVLAMAGSYSRLASWARMASHQHEGDVSDAGPKDLPSRPRARPRWRRDAATLARICAGAQFSAPR